MPQKLVYQVVDHQFKKIGKKTASKKTEAKDVFKSALKHSEESRLESIIIYHVNEKGERVTVDDVGQAKKILDDCKDEKVNFIVLVKADAKDTSDEDDDDEEVSARGVAAQVAAR
jgi:hypothetical protein